MNGVTSAPARSQQPRRDRDDGRSPTDWRAEDREGSSRRGAPSSDRHRASQAPRSVVDTDPTSLVFVGPKGGPPRRANFHTVWAPARPAVGLDEMHFHDYADFPISRGRRPRGRLLLRSCAGQVTSQRPRRCATARDNRPGRGTRGSALGAGPGGSGDHHFGRFAGYPRDIRGMEPKRSAGSSPSIAPEQGEQLERATGIEPA